MTQAYNCHMGGFCPYKKTDLEYCPMQSNQNGCYRLEKDVKVSSNVEKSTLESIVKK